jgi:hypothetical protein
VTGSILENVAGELRLVALLAMTGEHRARHAPEIRDLAASVDYDRLLMAMEAHKLEVLIGSRLLELVARDVMPPGFADLLDEQAEQSTRRALFLETTTVQVLAALEASGVRALALKGPLMARRIHGSTAMRRSGDIDLLVTRETFRAAESVLMEQGYGPVAAAAWEDGLPLFEGSLTPPQDWLLPIDLHWRLSWGEERFARALLARCVDHDGILEPRPEDELAMLVLLFGRDGFTGLRTVCDIGAWWDRHGAQLEAPALEETLRRHPELRRRFEFAALALEPLTGVPATGLVREAPASRSARVAARLADPYSLVGKDDGAAQRALVDLLLSSPREWGPFLRHHVFLPREVVVDAYDARTGRPVRELALQARYAAVVSGEFAWGFATALRRTRMDD